MNCMQTKELLTSSLLNELNPGQEAELQAHLQTCGKCRAEADELRAALQLLTDGLTANTGMPKALPEKSVKKITRAFTHHRIKVAASKFSNPVISRLISYGIAACFLLLLAGLLQPNLSRVSERSLQVRELSHLNELWKQAASRSEEDGWNVARFRPNFPRSLETLVEEGRIRPEDLVSPVSGEPIEYFTVRDSDGDQPLLVSHLKDGRNVIKITGQGLFIQDGTPEAEKLDRQLAELRDSDAGRSEPRKPETVQRGTPAPDQRTPAAAEVKEVAIMATTPTAQSTVARLTVDAPSSFVRAPTPMVSPPVKPHDIKVQTDLSKQIEAARIERLMSVRDFHQAWNVALFRSPDSMTKENVHTSGEYMETQLYSREEDAYSEQDDASEVGLGFTGDVKADLAESRSREKEREAEKRELAQRKPGTVGAGDAPAQPIQLRRAASRPEESSVVRAPTPMAPPTVILGDMKVSEEILSELVAKEFEDEEKEIPSEPVRRAAGVNPFVTAATQPFSTFSLGVDSASYTLARNYLQRGQLPPPENVRTEEFVNFFDYDYSPPIGRTFAIHVDCGESAFGRGLQLLKIGIKGRVLGREEKKNAILTLLVDTSGSMATPDRLGIARQALIRMVDRLDPADMVAIVQFDSRARLVLPHTSVADKQAIIRVIESIQTSGSTSLEEGMVLAYSVAARGFNGAAANRVMLISDGMANLGSTSASAILETVAEYRRQGITLSVFGFGFGSYNDSMLEALANKGDGVYAFIDSMEEAQRVMVDELSATVNIIAHDVKIQVEFNPDRVARYRQLGYETRKLKKDDFRDDSVDAGEIGSGQSATALYELELKGGNVREPIGVVRIRCRNALTGMMEEIERPIMSPSAGKAFSDMDPRFILAACAAHFAEILRGSPYAAGSSFNNVARKLHPVALELNMDRRIKELLRLTQTGLTPRFENEK